MKPFHLEKQSDEVKALYTKFGYDVDEGLDDETEDEGIQCLVTCGAPPSASDLEKKLGEVRSLYHFISRSN